MTEPLQNWVKERVAETLRMQARVRTVDLPVVAPDVRIGTLVHRARPVAPNQGVTCPQCKKGFWPRHHSQKYCDGVCSSQANRAKTPRALAPVTPALRRQVTENIALVQAICAYVWDVPVESIKLGLGCRLRGAQRWTHPRQAAMTLALRLVLHNKQRIAADFNHSTKAVTFAAQACVARMNPLNARHSLSFADKFTEAEARCVAALESSHASKERGDGD